MLRKTNDFRSASSCCDRSIRRESYGGSIDRRADSEAFQRRKERCCSKLLQVHSCKNQGRDRSLSCRKERSKGLVDVTGIEPVTPCLQNSLTTSGNPCYFNQSKENPKLNSSSGVWLYVRKCISLHVGSLQKSLQPSNFLHGAST